MANHFQIPELRITEVSIWDKKVLSSKLHWGIRARAPWFSKFKTRGFSPVWYLPISTVSAATAETNEALPVGIATSVIISIYICCVSNFISSGRYVGRELATAAVNWLKA